MIVDAFKKAYLTAKERGWNEIAVAVDLHGTVFVPNYKRTITTEFYPLAKEALQLMQKAEIAGIKMHMYMYTCTPANLKKLYSDFFYENDIWILPKENVMRRMKIHASNFQDFDEKPYFNVLLEDKAGFDPSTDWEKLINYFSL